MRDAYTEKWALDYIDVYGPPNNPKPEYLARMKYVANVIPDGSVLEAACGEGHLYAQIKRKEYIGIDSSPHMIAKAHEYFSEADFRVMDAFNLGNLTAETVVFTSLLIHIEPELHPILLQRLWERSLKQMVFTMPIISDKTTVEYSDILGRKTLITNISPATFDKLVSGLYPKPKTIKYTPFPPGSFGHGLNDYLIKLVRPI